MESYEVVGRESAIPFKAYKADEVDARIRELEEENEKLDVECTKRQLEIYRLRKALEFYADKEQYLSPPICVYGSKEGIGVMIDGGARATEALGGEKKTDECIT